LNKIAEQHVKIAFFRSSISLWCQVTFWYTTPLKLHLVLIWTI